MNISKTNDLNVYEGTQTGERPYKCQQCTNAFSWAIDLKRHERTHTGERPFKCQQCTKTFRQSSHLKVHERNHTGERPFKCQQCTKTFRQSCHLKVHERNHTGERPFNCQQCTKTFRQYNHLKCHEHTHTGEKPYKCDKCNKTFTRAYYLKHHERTHTSENNSTSSNDNERKSPLKNSQLEKFSQTKILARNLGIIEVENGYSYQVYQNKFPMNNEMKPHGEINQRTHTTARLFKCNKCDKDYTEANDLKYHQCTHTEFPQPNIPARNLCTIDGAYRNPYQVYHNKFPINNQMTYNREIHLEDEANHSKQSSSNIQLSTLIHPEQHSFKDRMINQNIANYPNSSTRFNAMDNANFPHQFISQNIQSAISPLDINVQTQDGEIISTLNESKASNPFSFNAKNGQNLTKAEISILDRSIEHPSESISFQARNITENSSTRFNAMDKANFPHKFISQNIQSTVSPLVINIQTQGGKNISTLNAYAENGQNLHNENSRLIFDNTDVNSQIQNVSLLENTYGQRFTGSSTQNEKRFSFLQMLLEN